MSWVDLFLVLGLVWIAVIFGRATYVQLADSADWIDVFLGTVVGFLPIGLIVLAATIAGVVT